MQPNEQHPILEPRPSPRPLSRAAMAWWTGVLLRQARRHASRTVKRRRLPWPRPQRSRSPASRVSPRGYRHLGMPSMP